MNDLKEEKGTREELRRSQAAPRRSGGGLKRALMVILALVVVLAVVVAAAWKDLSSLDSVRRLFSYNKVTQDEQGKVEMYSFSNDRSNTFALLGDHLIVASTTGVSIYGSSPPSLSAARPPRSMISAGRRFLFTLQAALCAI